MGTSPHVGQANLHIFKIQPKIKTLQLDSCYKEKFKENHRMFRTATFNQQQLKVVSHSGITSFNNRKERFNQPCVAKACIFTGFAGCSGHTCSGTLCFYWFCWFYWLSRSHAKPPRMFPPTSNCSRS